MIKELRPKTFLFQMFTLQVTVISLTEVKNGKNANVKCTPVINNWTLINH